MSETAPTTPVRDMPEKKKYGRLMKINQYSSTPSLDDNIIQNIGFDCDTRYLFKDSNCTSKVKNEKAATMNNGASGIHSSCQDNISTGSNLSDRMIQKFCKSFSWRFLRKVSSDDQDNSEPTVSNGYDKLVDDNVAGTKKHNYRFGPLSWRCSKERKEKLSTSSSMKSDETDTISVPDKATGNVSVQKHDNQTLVRRTLSDLNGYHDTVKLRTTSSVVPIKYRPPVPVAMKKHRQYELRRTVSQPLLATAKFSPALERKIPVSRIVQSEDERVVFSEDDMMSDSGSSIPSRKNSLERGINEDIVIYSEAVWDHIAMETEELPFRAGDVIEVYSALDRDWWWGTCCGKSGWFPSDFVRLRVNQNENSVGSNAVNCFVNLDDSNSIVPYSSDQVRSRIVCELINTERDFVKVLKDISEAYISECRKARDLFTDEQISTIFGNWEQLYSYQSEFFKCLEQNVNWETPYKSCVGGTFLQHHENFCIYSDYCNNHPVSIATLQQLYQNTTYNAFFEKCRIKGSLMEIPLDGFLLTPVQRICKYPLQLAELLKHTEMNHEDYENVKSALDTMKNVAVLINERKRRMESLEKLILWQQRVDCWEGEDLIVRSSQLIYQSEVTKIATGTFITNAMLFLFDHQLVYCKKDILKKNHYIYKGRMLLDNSEVVDVPDGKDSVLGFNIRNGIKVQNAKLHKWLLFCCRSQKEKAEWLDAFNRERTLVLKDEQNKLKITPTDRHLAYITAAACTRRHTFVKHGNKKFKRGANRTARVNRTTAGSSHLSRKVGTWFMFGASRKNHRRSSRLIP